MTMINQLYTEFHESWHPVLDKWAKQLLKVVHLGNVTYPPRELVFRVFTMPLEKIKLVI